MVLDTQPLLNSQSKHLQYEPSFFYIFFLPPLNIRLGLKIAIADRDEKNLAQVGHELTTIIGEQNVLVIPTDASKLDQVVRLRDRVYETWGEVRNRLWAFLSLRRVPPDGLLLSCLPAHVDTLSSDVFHFPLCHTPNTHSIPSIPILRPRDMCSFLYRSLCS